MRVMTGITNCSQLVNNFLIKGSDKGVRFNLGMKDDKGVRSNLEDDKGVRSNLERDKG
jgi:hypothetical protein